MAYFFGLSGFNQLVEISLSGGSGEAKVTHCLWVDMTLNVWNDILGRIETKFNRYSFYTFFQELCVRVRYSRGFRRTLAGGSQNSLFNRNKGSRSTPTEKPSQYGTDAAGLTSPRD